MTHGERDYELVAKVLGLRLCHFGNEGFPFVADDRTGETFYWNPQGDDGDSFRLAIALEMQVEYLDFSGNARARVRHLGYDQVWVTNYCIQGWEGGSSVAMVKDAQRAARMSVWNAAVYYARSKNGQET